MLVFNHIYRTFREDSLLVDACTLEILVNAMLSLRLSHADREDQLGALGSEASLTCSRNWLIQARRRKLMKW